MTAAYGYKKREKRESLETKMSSEADSEAKMCRQHLTTPPREKTSIQFF